MHVVKVAMMVIRPKFTVTMAENELESGSPIPAFSRLLHLIVYI